MLEKELLNWIVGAAEATGWLVKHVPSPMVADKRTGMWRPFARAAGLPDLFMLHSDPPRLIIAEVKGETGKLSPKQQEFLQAAQAVADAQDQALNMLTSEFQPRTLGVYAWAPKDMSIIEEILKTRNLL